MVVYILTRSEEIVIKFNRLGHCVAPTQVLEIDTALAEMNFLCRRELLCQQTSINCPVQYSLLTIMTSVKKQGQVVTLHSALMVLSFNACPSQILHSMRTLQIMAKLKKDH